MMKDNIAAIFSIIRHMSEGVLFLDQDGRILAANENIRACLSLGGDVAGRKIDEISGNLELNACIDEALRGHSKWKYAYVGERYVQIHANPVFAEKVQIGTVVLLFGISEQIQMEKVKQQFSANVSHELKTPLTSISGYAEMIETGMAKEEDVRNFAARIHKEAHRLLELISDIIRLSELDEEKEILRSEPVNLMEIADECADILLMSAKKRDVSLHIEGRSAVVIGDRGLIFELVYNLCDNAIRYNRYGGSVVLSVGENQISVKDTGIGIPKEHQGRIFERFYRVDESRSKKTGGTGLGLAIVKHIAERQRATLELSSEEGVGTEIIVRFFEAL